MERTKKLLYLPLAYHSALLLSLAVMWALKINMSAYGLLWLLDLCGVLISPMFMALMAISHAILHNGKVFDYLKLGCIYLAIIGILRILLYASQGEWLFAVGCAISSIAIFLLWEIIFNFTDKMMKKPRKRKR
jgi:hypothetical protein